MGKQVVQPTNIETAVQADTAQPVVEATETAITQTPGENGGSTPVPVKTFTQSELDGIIAQRLEQERRKYADYNDLRQRVQTYEAQEHQQQTQSAERLQQLEQQNQQLTTVSREKAIEAAIAKAAGAIGLDPEAATKLADLGALSVDEAGNVTNADVVVKSVAERFPGLLKRPMPQVNAVNPPVGATVPTRTDQTRRAEYFGGDGAGFWNSGGVRWTEQ